MESLVIVYNQFIDLVFFCLLCLLFTGSGTAATRATATTAQSKTDALSQLLRDTRWIKKLLKTSGSNPAVG